MSRELRAAHKIMVRMSLIGVNHILGMISKESDPLVKVVAIRRFKRGFDLPRSLDRYSAEFRILGEIYHSFLQRARVYGSKRKVYYSKSREIKLSREQEARVDLLLQDAILWAYRYWSSSTMAKIMLELDSLDQVEDLIWEYTKIRNMSLKNREHFKRMLEVLFR